MSSFDKPLTSTDAVHAGGQKALPLDSVTHPIAQTSTYVFENTAEIVQFMEGTHPRPSREEYGRYGNPTCRHVESRLAALEGTDDAILFSSGMAAITTAILSLVKAGQHVVLFQDCYRRTRQFVTSILSRFGVSHTLVAASDFEALGNAIKPNTRLVLGESPTNPHLSCLDLEKLVAVCKTHRTVRTLVDATFATPYNLRPAQYGVDLVVHSATKYLAGHNDVLAGVVSGPSHLISLLRDMRGVLGNVCDPHAAFLVGRGLKTLSLRVQRQNESGLIVARYLEKHPKVLRVYYPGLASHPDHELATSQMRGFGGVVSFVVQGGLPFAREVVDRMTLARIGPSFGGVESLIEPPAIMSYFELSPEQRAAIGIEEGLVRLALGIEDANDIVADLEQALATK